MWEKLPRLGGCAIPKPMVFISVLLFLIGIGSPVSSAQEPTARNEFWPGIDVYIHVKPKVRLYMLGAVSKSIEDGEFRNAQGYEGQIGVHVDYIPNDHVI